MSWFIRMADCLHSEETLRNIVLAIADMEKKMAADLSKLQSAVTAQGTIVTQVQAEVATLQAGQGSSTEQAAVDALTDQVTANNTALSGLVTAPST